MSATHPWLDHYPPYAQQTLGAPPYATLPAMLADATAKFGQKPAFENFGVTMSFAQLDRRSRDFAAYLQTGLGLRKGDRVAVMMPNLLNYPIALFGILRAGCIVVSVNPLYTARELELQLRDSGATAVVIFEGAAHTLQAVIDKTSVRHVVVSAVGDLLGFPKGALINFVLRTVKKMVPAWKLPQAVTFPAALAAGEKAKLDEPPLGPDDLAFLQYTGGTTGVSKGAMLAHRNVLADCQQLRAFGGPHFDFHDKTTVAALPFYHILALVINCMLCLQLGAKQLLITNPKDIPRLVKTLRDSGFAMICGVNTLYNALLNHPEFAEVDFSRLKLAGGGGAPLQLPVARRWKQITGRTLVEGYGLTETAGASTMNPPDIAEHSGTAGLPLPGTDIEIRADDGAVLPIGEIGQVFIRGPNVMLGYWNRPEDTARAIGTDGFLATGDMGTITPEGFLRIVDRLKDMILVSGFNVYPNEIEDVLAGHPGILEAAVIGVPDANGGEMVKAIIVRKDPALTPATVIAHCRASLTGYKVPRQVEFRDSLPKSPVGKILRRELRG